MTDQSVAAIARCLAKALVARAKSRSTDDQKAVLAFQTELIAEINEELKIDRSSLVGD